LKYQHIIRAVLARPWAIDPESLAWAAVLDVLSLRAAGDRLTDEEISARIAAAQNGPRAGGRRDRNVAVIPMYGVLSPKGDAFARSSGGTTAETLRDEFRAAVADPDIDGIVFDVDSPGGVVEGIGELADEIRGARGTKPIAAVANHMAASAAYWAIAGVDEIVATPSASVGSIGVFTAHQDVSAAMEEKGVKTTLISAGKYKVEGNQFEALGDEAREAIQADVNAWYDSMTSSIAKGRGVSAATVRATFGEGRTFMAKKAAEAGMVDRIDSLENTIRRVARGQVGAKPAAVARGEPYLVAFAGEVDPDEAATADSFAARVEAATAEMRAIGHVARERFALRVAEGRVPSSRDLEALGQLAYARGSLELPEIEEEAEPGGEAEAPAEEPATAARLRGLELLEAAARGGYRLNH
jgi:signal peptide peptidase SppA